MCCNVFNVWPKTTLLPVWPRGTKMLDTPAGQWRVKKIWRMKINNHHFFKDCLLVFLFSSMANPVFKNTPNSFIFLDNHICFSSIRNAILTLTGVAQLVGHCPAKQKVASSIPGQDPCPHCKFGPWSRTNERHWSWGFSPTSMFLTLSPPFPLSLKVNK